MYLEWKQDASALLDELVKPIPMFVRPMAKKKIEKFILEAAENNIVTIEAVVRGYIQSSSGDMKERAIKMLKAKGIDLAPYQDLI